MKSKLNRFQHLKKNVYINCLRSNLLLSLVFIFFRVCSFLRRRHRRPMLDFKVMPRGVRAVRWILLWKPVVRKYVSRFTVVFIRFDLVWFQFVVWIRTANAATERANNEQFAFMVIANTHIHTHTHWAHHAHFIIKQWIFGGKIYCFCTLQITMRIG